MRIFVEILKIFKGINFDFTKFAAQKLIILNNYFLKLKISLLSIFLKKDNRVLKALNDLEVNGVAIIKNFYSDKETEKIKNECFNLLNDVPTNKIDSQDYIQAESISVGSKTIYLEKLGSSIKLKGLNILNSFFSKIGRKIELSLITLVYHNRKSKPYLVYNVSHDGNSTHPVLKNYTGSNEAIAGKPHVDLYYHKLRCFLALGDVKRDNGATIYYNKSRSSNFLEQNYLNLFLSAIDIKINDMDSHYINENKLNDIKMSCKKSYLECQKGDLALIDLKTPHYAVLPKKGERQLLWFYY